jgi:hypothetical protein
MREDVMANDLVPVRTRASDTLHPMVYVAIAGLTALFVFSIWAFADGGYTEFLLAVVSGFFLMAAAIPFAIWHMWRKHAAGRQQDHESLRDWSSHDFDIQPGRMRGRDAVVEVLLPIAAVAFGMTALAIVLVLTAHYAA